MRTKHVFHYKLQNIPLQDHHAMVINHPHPNSDNSDDQCCALSYTSGTTGNPKGGIALFSFYIDGSVIVINISITAIIIVIMTKIIRDDAFT